MTFPQLVLSEWRETRDALHAYARVLGGIRRQMTPPAKHWWHVTLSVSARGLTTTAIPAAGLSFELVLNPMANRLELWTSEGGEAFVPIAGQSQRSLHEALAGALAGMGVRCETPAGLAHEEFRYVADSARQYWRALSGIDAVFKVFKGGLREETGPVHVFPHHFDISLNWFSGRPIPGTDPRDAENADEQMNFGFVTGDGSIPEAYFYATAYPQPEGLTDAPLPEGAYWHSEGFTGAVLPYARLADSKDPRKKLLAFLQGAHHAGSSLMI